MAKSRKVEIQGERRSAQEGPCQGEACRETARGQAESQAGASRSPRPACRAEGEAAHKKDLRAPPSPCPRARLPLKAAGKVAQKMDKATLKKALLKERLARAQAKASRRQALHARPHRQGKGAGQGVRAQGAVARRRRSAPHAPEEPDRARQGAQLPHLRRDQRSPAGRHAGRRADREHHQHDQRHGHPGLRRGAGCRDAADVGSDPAGRRRGGGRGSRSGALHRGFRVRPHHRPGAHVHARDGLGGAADARGRDRDRQAHRGRPAAHDPGDLGLPDDDRRDPRARRPHREGRDPRRRGGRRPGRSERQGRADRGSRPRKKRRSRRNSRPPRKRTRKAARADRRPAEAQGRRAEALRGDPLALQQDDARAGAQRPAQPRLPPVARRDLRTS